jgi:hypothetical protein
MKWMMVIAIMMVCQSQSCKKDSVKLPACIQDKIEAIKQQARYNPPATVYRYKYMDKYVFLFSSDCCDQFNYLYDMNCNMVCAPTGGITGRGDNRCPNFKTLASEETLIWRDER